MSLITLPNYKEQSPDVKERFDRLKKRSVKMTVNELYKTFDTKKGPILKNVSFSTYKREFTSVIGPSGCGKSTLIRLVAGLESIDSGSINVSGTEVKKPGIERGMVFQEYTLFPWLTVTENVMYGLLRQNRSKAEAKKEALKWINLVGLDNYQDAYPSQLSGGMKQRVAIARSLATQPEMLLMDEPFGALDAQTRARMQAYLLQIWRNIDISIMFVTHDLDEAVYLSDRIIVLKGNPGEIAEIIEVPISRPRSPEQFLTPEFLATKKRLEALIHRNKEEEAVPVIPTTDLVNEIM
ncbi:ABC transporter ATP-binding protein [Aquimarina agarilytica]|uniref:ABC transporter ATP-binding protein n=1 Tax=Aquimarina agarilytica TaxID=1087449 RepID=UPI000288F900|nr:ABC transporter ATP-binding protein [Aquimarina agarilytica]